jgi:DNA anti-recombination protein RmuC
MERKELTAADVWAMFAESDRRMQESEKRMQESDRRMQESEKRMQESEKRMQESEKRMQESREKERAEREEREKNREEEREKERAEREKERAEREKKREAEREKKRAEREEEHRKMMEKLEKLGENIGGIGESIGDHAEMFFQDALAKSLTFGGVKYDEMRPNLSHSGEPRIEFDIALINGSSIAIIEVKNKIRTDFIQKFAGERVEKFREVFPEYKNLKVYLGIAGFSFSDKVLEKAKEYGIGIIKQAGDSMEIDAVELRAY